MAVGKAGVAGVVVADSAVVVSAASSVEVGGASAAAVPSPSPPLPSAAVAVEAGDCVSFGKPSVVVVVGDFEGLSVSCDSPSVVVASFERDFFISIVLTLFSKCSLTLLLVIVQVGAVSVMLLSATVIPRLYYSHRDRQNHRSFFECGS